MRLLFIISTALIFWVGLALAEVSVQNPETSASITFPGDAPAVEAIEGGVVYSAKERNHVQHLYCGVNLNVKPLYRWKILWNLPGKSDQDILDNYMRGLESSMHDYYFWDYGSVEGFPNSRRVVAYTDEKSPAHNRFQIAVVVEGGILYAMETGERTSYYEGECSHIWGDRAQHERFIESLVLSRSHPQ